MKKYELVKPDNLYRIIGIKRIVHSSINYSEIGNLGIIKDSEYKSFDKEYELVKVDDLFQIKALKNFSTVDAGDLGGFVERENNLSQYGECWIRDDAKVFGYAEIEDKNVYGFEIVSE